MENLLMLYGKQQHHFSSSAGPKAACMQLQKKKNSVGNRENGYPVPDFNKTMINLTKELSDAHKKTLKEEISDKFMEKILDMVNKNIQHALKKFQDNKNKEHEMTLK
jgi:predicted SAM-dependent methyltransferase